MKYPPAPTLPSSEELGPIGFVAAAARAQSFAVSPVPDPEIIYATLRHAIGDDSFEAQTVFNTIAEAAQLLTGASAAALAIRRNGLVVCRARVGDAAPPLGARLSVDSGFSGECLRTNKVLRCDDTQKDIRVDPEVCRELGLRSIAAVPLRGPRGTMGVLETFSGRSFAFAEEHMAALMRLAELAEAGRMRESGIVSTAKPATAKAPVEPVVMTVSRSVDKPDRPAKPTVSQRLALPFPGLKRWYWAGGASVGIMVIALLSAWMWRSPENASAARAIPTQAETPSPTAPTQPVASGVLTWTPPPLGTKATVQRASKVEVDAVVRHQATTSTKTNNEAQGTDIQPTPSTAISSSSSEPPQMASLAPEKSLPGLVAPSVTMPGFSTPVSQGVVDGVLQRKVLPVYPTSALPYRLSGSVIMSATVDTTGRVQNLKVVSGHPLLAQAALSAVREWKYTPSTLNGKPIAVQKEITVSFKAPQ